MKRAAHVVEDRWHVGSFHKIYRLRCRCGWQCESSWASKNAEAFKEHKAQAEVSAEVAK